MATQIILNGQNRTFAEADSVGTVAELVSKLELKADRIAIEHNGTLAPRKTWPEIILHNHDRIELVHFVGGGIDSLRIA
jgi:sulfur carrier protein